MRKGSVFAKGELIVSWRTRVIGLLLLISALGCAKGLQVNNDFDKAADFTRYQTWDWMPGETFRSTDPRLDDPKVRERIKGAIENQLVENGFQRATEPDFHVNYLAALGSELEERRIDNYYEYSHYTVFYPHWTATYTGVYETGTLVIDILDVDTKRLVWRSTAKLEVNPQAGPRENEPKIREAVRAMLKRFPPK